MLVRLNLALLIAALMIASPRDLQAAEIKVARTIASGRWSDPATWQGRKIPEAGDQVSIQLGHTVTFDAVINTPLHSIQVNGILEFDPTRTTLLTVGLIAVGPDPVAGLDPGAGRPSLLVGTPDRPIALGQTATIRLAEVEGLDPEEYPAILCRRGRMEFHGQEVAPTWVKLGASIAPGDRLITLAEPVTGWKVGDRIIVTATRHQFAKDESRTPKIRQAGETEERFIQQVEGTSLTLDAPLRFPHRGQGAYRGEVALLTRNVVVESANPAGARGHTQYQRDSSGSISFAEFRHLGKPGKLGKYSLHFHQAGDTLRGSSVIGASIWESGNRWLTIHATNRLVVRDSVGYRSVGHGFFLEEGTEVDNVFDHNLAVQALEGRPLPDQALGYDRNEGAGFWWANGRNAFLRNVAVECDAYGFRFDPPATDEENPIRPIRGADGRSRLVDVRTEPFLQFATNEAHTQRRHGFQLGGSSEGANREGAGLVGPDSRHPFVVRDLRVWDSRWAFTPGTPGLLAEELQFAHCDFGFWRPHFDRQAYRGVSIYQCGMAYYATIGYPPDESAFPRPLDPVDDRPPLSTILRVSPVDPRHWRVSGISVDDAQVASVSVNGQLARPVVADFSRWEAIVEAPNAGRFTIQATARDISGLVEPTPHVMTVESEPLKP